MGASHDTSPACSDIAHLVPRMSIRALHPFGPIRFPEMLSSVMVGHPAMQRTRASTPSSGMLLLGSRTVETMVFTCASVQEGN